jgi:hypothetical protein
MNGIPPRLQYHDADGSYTYVIGERDPDTGQFIAQHTPVPLGTKLVLDYGGAERGWLRFRPFDDANLVPLHHAVPPPPDEGYTAVVRLPVLLQQLGLAQWTLGGTIVQNAVHALHCAFEHAREAAAGQLTVYVLRPSRQIPIASRNNEMHTSPVLEAIGWVERSDDTFGPRTVPPPLAVLAATPPRPQIAEFKSAAPAVPANSSASSNPAPANDDAGIPGATAAGDDLFGNMTPVGKTRPPF